LKKVEKEREFPVLTKKFIKKIKKKKEKEKKSPRKERDL